MGAWPVSVVSSVEEQEKRTSEEKGSRKAGVNHPGKAPNMPYTTTPHQILQKLDISGFSSVPLCARVL